MARTTRRKRRRGTRDSSPTLRSSSESEGGGSGGSEDERDESEKQERRWQLRRSTLESRAKGKEIMEDDEDSVRSSDVDDTTADEDDGEEDEDPQEMREVKGEEQQQQLHKEQQQLQERRHSKGAIPQEEICGICLSDGGNERGKLDCCDHFFCFACIMEWSKVESRCPMCKQRFITVMRPAVSGISRSRTRSFRIPTRDQVYEPSEEEIRLFTDPYQNTVCTECQEAGDEGLLLLCDRCDAAAHTYCVGLGRSVPRGDWFCHACQAIEMESSEEEDVEDTTFDTTDIDEEEGSGNESILGIIVGDVRPNLFAGRTRRSAAGVQGQVPLRRSTRRRVRRSSLSDSTGVTDGLMITMTSTSSGFFPYLMETHPARTLSHQRQVQATVQNRLQNMRENWNRYRSGEVQFGSLVPSVESSRPGSAAGGASPTRRLGRSTSVARMDVGSGEAPSTSQLTRGAGRAAESGDIEQAWVNMERAIRLGGSTAGPSQSLAPSRVGSSTDRRNGEVRPQGTPVSARTRERTHQSDAMTRANSSRGPPVERNFQADHHSRANSARTRDERHVQRKGWTDSAGEGRDLSNSRSSNSRHFDRRESGRQATPFENGHLDILSCGTDNSRSGYHLRESSRQHLSRTGNNPKDNAVTVGRFSSPTSRQTRNDTEGLLFRSILDDKDNSRGSGGVSTRSREAKESQCFHVQSILDDKDNSRGSVGVITRWREAKDAQALHGRSILDDKDNLSSRGSTEPTKRRESDRNRSQPLSEGRGQFASRYPNRDEEMKLMKAQCSELVKNVLKPILDKGTIDKNQFKELARCATHTILSSLGVPGLKHGIEVVAVGTITCDHEQPTSSSLIPGCCTSCVQRHVKRYVKSLVKEKIHFLQ